MPAKILVVDDEPEFERLILRRFRREIKAGQYDFLFAGNGLEALTVINQDRHVDMVLSDIAMPQMDGLSLIAKLKELKPLLKTVIVSAYGDINNIRKAMNLGAFDFVIKPIDFTDLKTTIEKTLDEVEVIQQIEKAKELKEKNDQLIALDQFKSRFFTNISHEFRTPLTVISGMADQIEENPERWLFKGLGMIRRNTHDLLQLVNQILDLRKLESGNMTLESIQSDIISYLKYVLEPFYALAETKDLRLHFLHTRPRLVMDFDPEKVLRILSNLLDNAIKFTPAGGHIYLQLDQMNELLHLRVTDTGIGIPQEEIPHLFDRFFQASRPQENGNKGTGIGLAMIKELIRLMDGDIQVQSQVGKGSVFTIKLPIRQQAPIVSEQHIVGQPNQNLPIEASPIERELAIRKESVVERPTLLIIEDNQDVTRYLTACLESLYELDYAPNGQLGIETALEKVPDLIISDVMMPEKDGFELCKQLKNDVRTSHIPIILLTAKADDHSRFTGLESGADAYLSKPFAKRELLIRLEKLLELREKLQARYQSSKITKIKEQPNQQEDQFVIKLNEAVLSNLEDENFGILQLCQAARMSRAQLHRKLKALTGRSASKFIRSIRLEKANELLNSTELNISQVAYEVGFKDPKYFSRTFQEEFGMSPREVRS